MAQRRIFRQRRPQVQGRQEQLIQPQSNFNPLPSKHISDDAQSMLDSIDSELENNAANPLPDMTGVRPDLSGGIDNQSARDVKNRRIAAAETRAARDQTRRTPASLAQQEAQPNLWNAEDLYKISAENRKKGGKRGIFIGIGAGGGIISVVAGIGFLSPFKLPGVMNTLVDDAGKRIQKVVEKRAEKVIVQYLFDKDKIATGNPIGDLFANIRTSNFEKRLEEKYGLKFERAENGNLRIVLSDKEQGVFKGPKELEQFLDRDDLNTKELRKVFKLVVGKDFSFFRFFTKSKFVRWLRLKYDVPRFGAREQKPDESDDDYKKNIAKEHYQAGQNANFQNMEDFANCAAESGDCADTNKGGGAEEVKNGAQQASEEIADEVATEMAKGGEKAGIKLLSGKMLALVGGGVIPLFGTIETAARLEHGLGKVINDGTLQKMHADFIKRSTGVVGALYAGYSDQTKAGGLPIDVSGMFADRLTGFELTQSYNLINNGTTVGEGLEPMERIGDNVAPPTWVGYLQKVWDATFLLRAPLEAWYNTVSRAVDAFGGIIGDFTSFVSGLPGIRSIMEQFNNAMQYVLEGIFKVVGMYIDPAAIGPKLVSYIHEGFVGAFNSHGAELGMRLLTHDQALAMDNEIRADNQEMMSTRSFADRMFDLDTPHSLASTLIAGMPSGTSGNLFGAIAASTMRLVAAAPGNIARATSGTAFAAEPTAISEDLFNTKAYGGTDADLSADLDPNAFAPTPLTCPANRDDAFNHCRVDREVVTSMNCVFVHCSDIDNPLGEGGGGGTAVVTGDTQHLAQQILDNKNITFEDQDNDQRGAKHDIQLAAAGAQTKCATTPPVTLDPTLLSAILLAAQTYTFRINALVSDHGCEHSRHPLGKAVDIGMVNGNSLTDPDAMPPAMIPIYRQFSIDFSKGMTTGGHINQKNCMGVLKLYNNVQMTVDDACHHVHMDVP